MRPGRLARRCPPGDTHREADLLFITIQLSFNPAWATVVPTGNACGARRPASTEANRQQRTTHAATVMDAGTGREARADKGDRKMKKGKKSHKKLKRERERREREAALAVGETRADVPAAGGAAAGEAAAGSAGAAPASSSSKDRPDAGAYGAAAAAGAGSSGHASDDEGSDARAASSSSGAAGGAGGDSTEGKAGGKAEVKSFKDLGLVEELVEACAAREWPAPTPIQQEAIPVALQDRDIIGLAETGSGKTGAFALPILQSLLERPQRLVACIIAPTRELAFQIGEQFDALGAGLGLKSCVVVGGVDMVSQAVALAKKPHVVIGTPGRLVDHIENTKGFSLRTIRYLVLDEADKMLSMDFEEELDKILQVIPRDRRTYLFSATMTAKVAKLQRASLINPVKVEVSSKYTTVKTLVQQYLFIPAKYKDVYLTYVLNEFAGKTAIVFVSTCNSAQRLAIMLRSLGFPAVPLHGQMTQVKRLGALNKFKAGSRTILLATDVASRGLDIPSVDIVLNLDVPQNGKDYIHRVGRTARAGRAGRAVTFVTQYDVELYQRIEALIGQKLAEFPAEEETVLVLQERVAEAQRHATLEMRRDEESGGGRRGRGRRPVGGDDDAAAGVIRESQMKRRRLAGAIQRNKRSKRG